MQEGDWSSLHLFQGGRKGSKPAQRKTVNWDTFTVGIWTAYQLDLPLELCFTILLGSVKKSTFLCNVLKIAGYNLFLFKRSITLCKVAPCAQSSPGSCSFVCCLIFLSVEEMGSWKQYQHDTIAYTLIDLVSDGHRGCSKYLTLCSELFFLLLIHLSPSVLS